MKTAAVKNLFVGLTVPSGPRPPVGGFSITLRKATLGRTSLDERSTRRTDLLTYNTKCSPQTSMLPPGFKPAIPAS